MAPDHHQRLTRRELMRAAGLGMGGAALLARAGAYALRDDRPYGPFRMGIQSYSLRGFGLDTALQMTQKEGLHYWEAFQSHVPLTDSTATIAQTLAKAKDHRIRIVAWGVQSFDGNEVNARRAFDFAKRMGLATISADPAPEAFPILDRLVDQYRINIAIHNHGPGARYSKISQVAAAIKNHHPRIGACVDTGHYLRSGEDPVEAVRTFGKRTYDIHLKDVKGGTQFTEIGKGDLRVVELFRVLHRMSYPHLVALEYEEHESEPGPYIDECLAATRDAIQKALAR